MAVLIPSGGCMVGRCWEACLSRVPVSLVGLSAWLAGYTQSLCIISSTLNNKKQTKQDRTE